MKICHFGPTSFYQPCRLNSKVITTLRILHKLDIYVKRVWTEITYPFFLFFRWSFLRWAKMCQITISWLTRPLAVSQLTWTAGHFVQPKFLFATAEVEIELPYLTLECYMTVKIFFKCDELASRTSKDLNSCPLPHWDKILTKTKILTNK